MALDRQAANGRYTTTWDGRNDSGSALLPKLYILNLKLDADQDVDVRQAVV